jgi:hypothetical protein
MAKAARNVAHDDSNIQIQIELPSRFPPKPDRSLFRRIDGLALDLILSFVGARTLGEACSVNSFFHQHATKELLWQVCL